MTLHNAIWSLSDTEKIKRLKINTKMPKIQLGINIVEKTTFALL